MFSKHPRTEVGTLLRNHMRITFLLFTTRTHLKDNLILFV